MKGVLKTLEEAQEEGRKHLSLTDPEAEMMYGGRESKVLSDLSRRLLCRDLFAVELQDSPFPEERVNELRCQGWRSYGCG